MLVFMAIMPMGEVLYQLQLLFAVVFLLGHVTRFLLIDQGRLQRLFARLLLTSRSSRTVPTPSAPPAPSNLSSNHILLLWLEVTLKLDLLLLLPTMEQSQLVVLVLLVDTELVPLPVDMEQVLLLAVMELVPLSVELVVALFLVVSLVDILVVSSQELLVLEVAQLCLQ